jgi:hypothetical protein
MKFRAKISFMAFKKNMTIAEMIIKQVKDSFDYLVEKNYIYQSRFPPENEHLFETLLLRDTKLMLSNIIKMNINAFQAQKISIEENWVLKNVK